MECFAEYQPLAANSIGRCNMASYPWEQTMNKILYKLTFLAVALLSGPAGASNDVYITVLGIAQDAGYPQASCYQPHCIRAWENKDLKRLTSSIAVVDEESKAKYLFDATPDIREQLYQLHRVAPDCTLGTRPWELEAYLCTQCHACASICHRTGRGINWCDTRT
jgi:hypothetical protein